MNEKLSTLATQLMILSMLLFTPSVLLADAERSNDNERHRHDTPRRPQSAEESIEQLIYCYAEGADAIGNGTTNADPEAAGLAIFRKCFTDDATFALWPAGFPFDSPTFPDRSGNMPPLVLVEGPAAWASFTNQSFRSAGGVGYDFVQHLIGNTQVEVKGKRARLTAYLNSTHVILGAEPFAPSRCMQQANGTYSLNVKRIKGRWMITSLDLTQMAFNNIIETGDGC